MLLGTYYGGVELHREEKIAFARFLSPHRVISTCGVNGGLRDDLDCLYNHQLCEPTGHHHGTHERAIADPAAYHQMVSGTHGLTAETSATMGTAANMNCLALAVDRFRNLEVIAACTAGVEANAGRAGDPASIYEWDGRFESIRDAEATELHGTINTMVLISQELGPGAMVQTLTVASEAKVAALEELGIHSRYSDGPATGTGTDQIAIASRLTGKKPLAWTGKHSKLGELVGRTVHDAIKQALAQQNHLTPAGRCWTLAQIERFGVTRESMTGRVEAHLAEEEARLFRANFVSINRDPLTVAAVAALVLLRDKLSWGILPESCCPEILCAYGAQLAAAVAGKPERVPTYHARLALKPRSGEREAFLDLICQAIAVGFRDKWS